MVRSKPILKIKTVGLCPTPRKLFEKSLTKNYEECALRIPGVRNMVLMIPTKAFPQS